MLEGRLIVVLSSGRLLGGRECISEGATRGLDFPQSAGYPATRVVLARMPVDNQFWSAGVTLSDCIRFWRYPEMVFYATTKAHSS